MRLRDVLTLCCLATVMAADADGRITRIRYVMPRHLIIPWAANWVGPGRSRKSTPAGANGVIDAFTSGHAEAGPIRRILTHVSLLTECRTARTTAAIDRNANLAVLVDGWTALLEAPRLRSAEFAFCRSF